jgi:hypothetical protein
MSLINHHAIRVLNELRAAEMSSLLRHMADTGYFVTMTTADDAESLKRIDTEEREHVQWLEEAIFQLRGGIWPGRVDTRQAGYHYWSLERLMPEIFTSKEHLTNEYASALAAVDDPVAIPVITRIYNRLQAHLETLMKLDQANRTQSS